MAIVEKPTIYVPEPVSDKVGRSGYIYLVTSFGVANTSDEEAKEAYKDIKKIIEDREVLKNILEKELEKAFNLKFVDIESFKEGRGGFLYLVYDNEENPKVAGSIGCFYYEREGDENTFGVCTAAFSCDVKEYGEDKCKAMAMNFSLAASKIELVRREWYNRGKREGKL